MLASRFVLVCSLLNCDLLSEYFVIVFGFRCVVLLCVWCLIYLSCCLVVGFVLLACWLFRVILFVVCCFLCAILLFAVC